MKSALIRPKEGQLVLDFEPGLVDRYASLRDCVATGVYQRGLKRIAIDLDQAPSNLSVQLSDDMSRHFSVDSLEKYLDKTGDLTPIYYLVEKYVGDKSSKKVAAMEALQAFGPQFVELLKQAGLTA
jgi:hypothetical protein